MPALSLKQPVGRNADVMLLAEPTPPQLNSVYWIVWENHHELAWEERMMSLFSGEAMFLCFRVKASLLVA